MKKAWASHAATALSKSESVVLVLIGDQTLLRDVDVDGHAVDELYGIELEFQYAVDAAAVSVARDLTPHHPAGVVIDNALHRKKIRPRAYRPRAA